MYFSKVQHMHQGHNPRQYAVQYHTTAHKGCIGQSVTTLSDARPPAGVTVTLGPASERHKEACQAGSIVHRQCSVGCTACCTRGTPFNSNLRGTNTHMAGSIVHRQCSVGCTACSTRGVVPRSNPPNDIPKKTPLARPCSSGQLEQQLQMPTGHTPQSHKANPHVLYANTPRFTPTHTESSLTCLSSLLLQANTCQYCF